MTSNEELSVMNGDFVDATTTEKKFRKLAGVILVLSLAMCAAFVVMQDPLAKRSLLFNRLLQSKHNNDHHCNHYPSGCGGSGGGGKGKGSDDAILFNRRLNSKSHNHDHSHGHNDVDDDEAGKGKGKGSDDAFFF